jgi:hypothetical protein
MFAYISYDFKSELHFYTGAGGSGRLTQADYVVILEEVVAPNWDANWILLEDNDNSHGTRGVKDNTVLTQKYLPMRVFTAKFTNFTPNYLNNLGVNS